MCPLGPGNVCVGVWEQRVLVGWRSGRHGKEWTRRKKPCQVFLCGYASLSPSGRLQKGNKGASSLAVSDVRHLPTRKSREHVVGVFADIFPFLPHLFGTLSAPWLLLGIYVEEEMQLGAFLLRTLRGRSVWCRIYGFIFYIMRCFLTEPIL